MKLYDNSQIKEFLTDKANVYDYLSKKLGSNRMIKELYKIYESPEEINFDELPNRFMLNQNNYCNVHLPIFNKQIMTEENKNTVYEYFKHWFGLNYAFVNGFELQYKNIKPKIIVERLYPKVTDWQILCAKGQPLFVCFYDEKNHIYNKFYKLNDKGYLQDNIPQKKIVDEFIELSKELSKGFKLVRVDFMLIDNTYPFFCEFTFTPYSGYASKDIIEYNSKDYADICADIIKG